MGGALRSARLVAWGNAWLGGHVGHDELLDRVVDGDETHDVVGVPGEPAEVSLGWALGRFRVAGVTRLRLLLPVPGDTVGAPGPASFRGATVEAGEGVLTTGANRRFGVVPVVEEHVSPFDGTVRTVRWRVFAVDDPTDLQLPRVAEAELELATALRATTSRLIRLDVARWRPELAGPLQALRDEARNGGGEQRLPAGYPPRAARLLATADRLGSVVELATGQPGDHGAALTGAEMTARADALRELAQGVRRARLAAYNAYDVSGG